MSYDPCQQLSLDLPAPALPRAGPAHAVHHTLGRIWRHRAPHHLALGPPGPAKHLEGCETHVTNLQRRVQRFPSGKDPLRAPPPFVPAAALLLGLAPVAFPFVWFVGARLAHHAVHRRHGGQPVPLTEPATLLLFALCAVIFAVLRPRSRPCR